METGEEPTLRPCLSVAEAEQQLLNYLMVYKTCRTPQERAEVRYIIMAWEAWIAHLREAEAANSV